MCVLRFEGSSDNADNGCRTVPQPRERSSTHLPSSKQRKQRRLALSTYYETSAMSRSAPYPPVSQTSFSLSKAFTYVSATSARTYRRFSTASSL